MRKTIAAATIAAAALTTSGCSMLHLPHAKQPTIVHVGDYGYGDPTDAETVACAAQPQDAQGEWPAINEAADRSTWVCEYGA